MIEPSKPQRIGRYVLFEEVASGGMATVHLGRLVGPGGFSRTVAIKRLHPQFAKDPEFVAKFLDEARLAARIRHPNVVPTLDVVASSGELFLVMEYVTGESLARLTVRSMERDAAIPLRVVSAILSGALHGLHAAHESTDERGMPLDLVHRDFTPHNILVDVGGVPRVLDFGIAKAAGRTQHTREGEVKGKFAYMPPEQIEGRVSRLSDVFAAGVVLWEALTLSPLFRGESEAHTLGNVLTRPIPPPSSVKPEVPAALDAVALRALDRDPRGRFATAHEMAVALEGACSPAPAREVREWLLTLAGEAVNSRALRVSEIETADAGSTDASFASEPSTAPSPSSPRREGGATEDDTSRLAPATDASSRRSSPRARVLLGTAALLLLAGAALGARSWLERSPAAAGTSTAIGLAASEPVAAPPKTASRSEGSAPSEPAPAALAHAASAALAATVSRVEPTAASSQTTLRASGSAPPLSPARPASRGGCDPPYTLDAEGHKKWKPACM